MIFHEKIYNSCKTSWVFELLRVLKYEIRSIHRPDDYLNWRCLISMRLWFTGVWIQVYLCTYLWFVTDFFHFEISISISNGMLLSMLWVNLSPLKKTRKSHLCVSDHVKQLQNIRLNSSVAVKLLFHKLN